MVPELHLVVERQQSVLELHQECLQGFLHGPHRDLHPDFGVLIVTVVIETAGRAEKPRRVTEQSW